MARNERRGLLFLSGFGQFLAAATYEGACVGSIRGGRSSGRVPCSVSKTRPELGPLMDFDDLGVFEGKVVQRIFAQRLLGPESLRFCRKFRGMSMQAVADLLQVDRRTVQRWESEESPVPPWAMLLVAKMADERSKGRAVMRTWLIELADEEGRPTEIDLDVA